MSVEGLAGGSTGTQSQGTGAQSQTGGQESSSQATGATSGATGGTGQVAQGSGGEQVQKYTPNFKYKVTQRQDGSLSQIEKELPEWARPFVTSSDLEKNFREVFEKSDGIESVKEHRDRMVAENTALREQWGPTVQVAQQIIGHLQNKDLDSAFEALGISENDVFQYALKRLQLREDPRALQTHDQMRQLQLQNQQLQQQVQQYSTGYESIAVQTRQMELNMNLQRPEVSSVAQAFDAKVGTPGAFRNEVIRRGQSYAAMGKDAPVEQVVSEVMQLVGWQGQPTQGQPAQQVQQTQGAGEQKPTFPVIKGKGTSPAQRAIKSTDELRQLARAMR